MAYYIDCKKRWPNLQPNTLMRILWEIGSSVQPASSGNTEKEAWAVQGEIERLEDNGYRVIDVELA